jgi:hypothetical protein
MKYKDKTIEEIHKIREENYNTTKSMSPKEYIEKVNKSAEKAAKQYGFRIEEVSFERK